MENQMNSVSLTFFAIVLVLFIAEMTYTLLRHRRERLDRLNAENERELEAKARAEFWTAYHEAKETERQRSRSANEERAKRKAERGAVLDARRLANLERKKG